MIDRITRISGSYYPAKNMGGAVTADFEFDKALSRLSIQVDVVTSNAGIEDAFSDGCRICIDGVTVTYFSYFFSRNVCLSIGALIRTFKLIIFRREVSDKTFYIVSGVWGLTSLLSAVLLSLTKRKFSIVTHGSLMDGAVKYKNDFLKKMLLKTVVKYVLRTACFVQFTSGLELARSVSNVPQLARIKVIPLGLDFNKIGAPDFSKIRSDLTFFSAENINVILFVGRIEKIKGLSKLVALIANMDSSTKLVIIGPDEGYQSLLVKDYEQAGVLDKVVFLGPLYDEELYYMYKIAKLLVVPSISENFCMTVVEAGYFRTPAVLSDSVGISSLLEPGVDFLLINDFCSEYLKIISLLNDCDRLSTMSESIRDKVIEKFNISKVAADYLGGIDNA